MIVWVFFLSAFIALMGAVAYIVTPRIKPNPWFGFRVGYTLIDREVWVKGNKLTSKLFIADGLIFAILSLLLPEDYLLLLLILFEVSAMACIIAAIIYVDDLAEKVTGRKPGGDSSKVIPIMLDPKTVKYPITLSIFYLILASIILYTANFLPDTIAVHFDPWGVPNRYDSRQAFTTLFIAALSLDYAFYMVFYYLAKYKPLVFYSPRLGFSTTEFVKLLSLFFSLIFIIVGIGYTIVFTYNFYGYHIIPVYCIFLLAIGTFLAIPVFITKIKGGREYG